MNKQKQREAIAAACGWQKYNGASLINYEWAPGHVTRAVPRWFKGAAGNGLDVPPDCPAMEIADYLGSLDAMHEAEKSLTAAQDAEYLGLLRARHGRDGAILTTASERAEAFLRALGKWEPETK